MSDQGTINPSALESLFSTWQEPNKHRIKVDKAGDAAKVIDGRRPSPIVVALS